MASNHSARGTTVLLLTISLLAAVVTLPATGTAHYCKTTAPDKPWPDCDGSSCPDDGVAHRHKTSQNKCSSRPSTKTYCEDADEMNVHVYGPGDGGILLPPVDGSALSVDECGAETIPYDGHDEYAIGGAWLLACESFCGDSGLGGGSSGCYGTFADHPTFPTVHVYDYVAGELGLTTGFTVAADYVSASPVLGTDCGDFEADYAIGCVDVCTVPFPPGLDGSYQVFVSGTEGMVWT